MTGAVIRRNMCVNNHLICSGNSIFIFASREHAISFKKKDINVGSRDDVNRIMKRSRFLFNSISPNTINNQSLSKKIVYD
jgi:hypothetical protein